MVVVGRGKKENIAEQCSAIVMSWECQMEICMVVWKGDFLYPLLPLYRYKAFLFFMVL